MSLRRNPKGLLMIHGPSPHSKYPLADQTRLVFLNNIIKNPNIIVGDYTYYDDFENPENFERNVLYHFDFVGDQLLIGNFARLPQMSSLL